MTTVKDFVTNINNSIDEINREYLPEKGVTDLELKIIVEFELQKIILENKEKEKFERFDLYLVHYELDYISICKTFRLNIQRLIPNKRNPKNYIINRITVADKFLNKDIEDILNNFVNKKLEVLNESEEKAKKTAELIQSYMSIEQLHAIIAEIKSNKHDYDYKRALRKELQIKDILYI